MPLLLLSNPVGASGGGGKAATRKKQTTATGTSVFTDLSPSFGASQGAHGGHTKALKTRLRHRQADDMANGTVRAGEKNPFDGRNRSCGVCLRSIARKLKDHSIRIEQRLKRLQVAGRLRHAPGEGHRCLIVNCRRLSEGNSVAHSLHAPVATGSMRNRVRPQGIEAPRGACDGGSEGWSGRAEAHPSRVFA